MGWGGGGGRQLYCTVKLRDQNVKEQFNIEIRNRFEALASNEGESIKQDWLKLEKVYCESADAVLGERGRINSNWFSEERDS